MTKILYLLGAGASAKSLPIVSEFRIFILYFKLYLADLGISEDSLNKINAIYEEISFYPSPDTYGRKLELCQEYEKLKMLNNTIGLMFTWKESREIFKIRTPILSRHFENEQKIQDFKEKTKANIDPRYIAFFLPC